MPTPGSVVVSVVAVLALPVAVAALLDDVVVVWLEVVCVGDDEAVVLELPQATQATATSAAAARRAAVGAEPGQCIDRRPRRC
ncbi:MAG: hypothetical protein ACXVR1_09605 [Solirubrobacteraceae bacterium]